MITAATTHTAVCLATPERAAVPLLALGFVCVLSPRPVAPLSWVERVRFETKGVGYDTIRYSKNPSQMRFHRVGLKHRIVTYEF